MLSSPSSQVEIIEFVGVEQHVDQAPMPPGQPGKDYNPIITPNNISLPWKAVDGVKVYHLIAEPVKHDSGREYQP